MFGWAERRANRSLILTEVVGGDGLEPPTLSV
jgi:hypothetical protein